VQGADVARRVAFAGAVDYARPRVRIFPIVVLLALARIAVSAEQTVTPLTPHAEQRVEPVSPSPEQHVEAIDPAKLQQVVPSTPPTTTEKVLDTAGKVTVAVLGFGLAVGTTLAMLLFL